jgi:hypothetical protein
MQHEAHKQEVSKAFQVLDLNPTSSWKKIRFAYRTQAKKWHPDTNNSEDAKTRTAQINEAFDFLSNFFDKAGLLNDPSRIIRSLTIGNDQNIKTNHRGQLKKRLIRFYNTKLASEDRRKDRRMETILIHMNFYFSFVNVLIMPPTLTLLFGWNGLLMALTSNLIFLLFTMSAVRNLHRIRFLQKATRDQC